MTATKKTDSHDPAAKLALRRHFLRRYHADAPPHVIDCCQGSGLLWGQLRREFPLASCWGLDQKPKKGRLKIDSSRVLAQPGWRADVVDIDTYGTPWKHWLAVLSHVAGPLTVFLTVGRVYTGGALPLAGPESRAIGISFCKLKLPGSFSPKLRDLVTDAFLAAAVEHGLAVVEAIEAASNGNARYIGLRLEPTQVSEK